MRRLFDYAHSCPKIDAAIRSAKNEIVSKIDSIVSDCCPLLDRSKLVDEWAEELYSALEDIFEETRCTNSDMRDAAENQLGAMQAEIDRLESEVEELTNQLNELEQS